MKEILIAVSVMAVFTGLTSCNKEEDHHTDEPNTAIITITNPIVDSHIHHNDTLQVRGTIVSQQDMHGYTTSIITLPDSVEVFSYEDHYHGTNKNLHIDWPCTINADVEMQLTITATLDHDGNTTSESVNFHCEP